MIKDRIILSDKEKNELIVLKDIIEKNFVEFMAFHSLVITGLLWVFPRPDSLFPFRFHSVRRSYNSSIDLYFVFRPFRYSSKSAHC